MPSPEVISRLNINSENCRQAEVKNETVEKSEMKKTWLRMRLGAGREKEGRPWS